MKAAADLDPVIHPPARLAIMGVLSAVTEAEFALLRDTAGISDSVLSKHLAALAEAGHVTLRKAALDGRQRTWVSMTRGGKAAFRAHIVALTELAGGAV